MFAYWLVTNETLYDSVVSTKATGVMRGLPINGDQLNAEETKLTNNDMFPQNR